MTLVPDSDLPESVRVKSNSFTIPLSRFSGGVGTYGDRHLTVQTIDRPQKEGDSPTANVSLSRRFKSEGLATIKTGDILLIGDKGHLVRNIVPEDAKLKTVGWVEFAPQPIPEADLIRDKKAFVRPTEKKEK